MDLHVTSPLLRGAEVLSIQKLLAQNGYSPGTLDGAYGPTTASAVKAFEADQRLPADGVVTDQLRALLVSVAATRAPGGDAPPPRTSSPSGLLAVAKAVEYLGVKESPPGSNRTMFGEWFGVNGVPWCNIFVSYCFKVAADSELCAGSKGAGVRPGKGCAFVPTTEAWLQSSGFWVGRSTPLPGDIAIFNWDGGRPDHIGIVEAVMSDGSFQTVEGNTAVGNDSNGGEVMRRQRYLTQVDGFGRIT